MGVAAGASTTTHLMGAFIGKDVDINNLGGRSKSVIDAYVGAFGWLSGCARPPSSCGHRTVEDASCVGLPAHIRFAVPVVRNDAGAGWGSSAPAMSFTSRHSRLRARS